MSLQKVDMGVKTDSLVSVYLARFVPNATPEQLLSEHSGSTRKALLKIRDLPNVVSAAAGTDFPYSQFGEQRERRESLRFTVRGQGASEAFRNAPAQANYITPGYFATLGIPILEGRDFTELDDRSNPNFVIINRRMAKSLFKGYSAIGQQLRWSESGEFSTVIEVAGDIKYSPFETENGFEIYYTYSQIPMPQIKAVVAVRGDPATAIEALRNAVREADSRIAIVHAKPLSALAAESLWQRRLWGYLFALFAILALTLAAVGLYGVISYLVSQRTREIGIRMALGAPRSSVLGWVTGRGMTLVGVGAVLGMGLSVTLSLFVESLLFGVRMTDPATWLLAPAVLAATGLLACLIPAWRATRIDPLVALRGD